jgi:hypothetical protein
MFFIIFDESPLAQTSIFESPPKTEQVQISLTLDTYSHVLPSLQEDAIALLETALSKHGKLVAVTVAVKVPKTKNAQDAKSGE